ncbi:MAG: Hsp20/alpha crystallin family protein, partial [Burkholderiales bacterium]
MKLDLSKWNPFKFFRKTPDEKRAERSSSAATAATAGLPAVWPEPLPLFIADPFRIMQDALRDPFAG